MTYVQAELELGLGISTIMRGPQHPPVHNVGTTMMPEPELDLGIDSKYFPAWNTARWLDCRGYRTPLDEQTGLTVPILPIEPPGPNSNVDFVDYHHLFHPEADLLQGDDADIALRRSFGQDLPRWLHEHYHNYFAGPELSSNRSQKFTTIVLACAGIVPRQAIEFTKDGPVHRKTLTDSQYTRVRATTRHEGQGKGRAGEFYRNQIGMFFANYAVEKSIETAITNSVIDEFLNTKQAEKRAALGNKILRDAIVLSLEPAKPILVQARAEGLVDTRRKGLGALICEYFVLHRRKDYYRALDAQLAAHAA